MRAKRGAAAIDAPASELLDDAGTISAAPRSGGKGGTCSTADHSVDNDVLHEL